MICAKALAVGLRKRVSVCTGQADFDNDCKQEATDSILILYIYDATIHSHDQKVSSHDTLARSLDLLLRTNRGIRRIIPGLLQYVF